MRCRPSAAVCREPQPEIQYSTRLGSVDSDDPSVQMDSWTVQQIEKALDTYARQSRAGSGTPCTDACAVACTRGGRETVTT